MEKIAIKNLCLLQNSNDFLGNQFKLTGVQFEPQKEDTYDQVYTPNQLEYPVYFTFHEVMLAIQKSYSYDFHGFTNQELIEMMDTALDTLYEYYTQLEDETPSFEELIINLDYKVDFLKVYSQYGWCYYLPLWCKTRLNTLCKNILSISREIIDDYIEFIKDPGSYSDEEDFLRSVRNKKEASSNTDSSNTDLSNSDSSNTDSSNSEKDNTASVELTTDNETLDESKKEN